jgi:large subunit ribosomal protein L23
MSARRAPKKKPPLQPVEAYDIILAPIVTEKSTMASEENKVLFRVKLDASKPGIKSAIEALFDVKVKAVNTLRVKGKRKVSRGIRYERSDWKKAIITLEEGYSIDVTTGL